MRSLPWATTVALCCSALSLQLVGCDDAHGTGGAGGAGTTGHGAHGSTAASGSTTTGATTGSTSVSSGTAGGTPLAPVLQSVEPLDGGLHVMWMNTTPSCEKIEIDRKKDAGAYATVFTVAGQAFEQHDDGATAPGVYCYQLRCVIGAEKSPNSNEKCGTP